MQYRMLGRTRQKVSCIGFGGIPIVGLNEEAARRVLNAALDSGINFIDTARGYKESEELIGKSISERRKEFFLATKTRGRDEAEIRLQFEKSRDYLRSETIDLYQIHYVNTPGELESVMEKGAALDVIKKLQAEKAVRYIGITGHDPEVLLEAAKTGEFDTIQGAFSYVEKDERIINLIEYCHQNDIGFIAQKPLAGGAISCATAGLKWIMGYPVSVVIPGMLSVKQVVENAKVGESDFVLTEDERRALEDIASRLSRNFCRRCYYCQPVCPQEIRIGVVLEFYGKAMLDENLALAQRWYRGMSPNVQDCTWCGLCEPECPYDLPIMDMLKKAHDLLK